MAELGVDRDVFLAAVYDLALTISKSEIQRNIARRDAVLLEVQRTQGELEKALGLLKEATAAYDTIREEYLSARVAASAMLATLHRSRGRTVKVAAEN